MTDKAMKYTFINGGSCPVKPGSALHALIERLVSQGFTYRKMEKYEPRTFTLWDVGRGGIEVHYFHPTADLSCCERVVDPAAAERARKRDAARMRVLEEKEADEGLTDAQQEELDKLRDEVAP